MKLTRIVCLAMAMLLPLALAACNEEGVGGLMTGSKETRSIPPETLKLMDDKGMRKEDPILIRVFKEESTLEIWKRDQTGHFALLKSYGLCAWGGTIGPKIVEGDKQSPEGFYQVTPGRMNPHSQFFLSFDLGYPNAYDRAFNRTGSAVMVHGNCTASAGCFVLTDSQVQEVYAIAREALAGGQSSFQVQAYPFRMTAANLARHRRNPNMAFWRNLKEGNDHFEVTRLEPKVDVCERKYLFDAHPVSTDSTTFNAQGACPAYKVPEQIADAVAVKQKADDADFKIQMAEIDQQERAQTEAELAMKMEAAKPKRPTPDLLASIMPKPADAAVSRAPQAQLPVSVATATPINVPVPRPSPLDVAVQDTKAGYQPTEKPGGSDVIGNFLSYVKIPDLGKKTETATAQSPDTAPGEQIRAPAPGQIAQPRSQQASDVAPIAPPAGGTSNTASALPVPASKPAVAAAAVPAAAEPQSATPWWKKLNPFGG